MHGVVEDLNSTEGAQRSYYGIRQVSIESTLCSLFISRPLHHAVFGISDCVVLSATLMVKAENYAVQTIYEVLKPIASDPNFATCQTDSNYTMLSFENPSLNQTEGFCASSACQALLITTLSSGLLPDCQVVIGTHSLNLTDAVVIASKCGESALDESAVKTNEAHNQLGHTADNIAAVVGHSVPMDELGGVLSTIMSIFRK